MKNKYLQIIIIFFCLDGFAGADEFSHSWSGEMRRYYAPCAPRAFEEVLDKVPAGLRTWVEDEMRTYTRNKGAIPSSDRTSVLETLGEIATTNGAKWFVDMTSFFKSHGHVCTPKDLLNFRKVPLDKRNLILEISRMLYPHADEEAKKSWIDRMPFVYTHHTLLCGGLDAHKMRRENLSPLPVEPSED